MMVDDILQLAHNQQFLERITNGLQDGGNLELLKKLPKIQDLHDFELNLREQNLLNFQTVFHEPVGTYLFRTFLFYEHSVDKAVFINDVEMYQKLKDPSAKQNVAEKIYYKYLLPEMEDHIQGISVFSKTEDHQPWYAQRRSILYSSQKELTNHRKQKKLLLLNNHSSNKNKTVGNHHMKHMSNHSQAINFKHGGRSSYKHNSSQLLNNTSSAVSNNVSMAGNVQVRTSDHSRTGPEHESEIMDDELNSSLVMNENNNRRGHHDQNMMHSMSFMTENTNTIGIYGRAITKIKRKIDNQMTDSALFDSVYDDVLNDLRLDAFPRFEESPYYTMYIRCKAMERKQITIRDFVALKNLGRGAFGLVHACEKRDCGKLYAMKQINKKRVQATDSLQTVMQERDYLAMMNSRFVTSLKYAIVDDDTIYIILDLMLGGDLKYHLNMKEKFPEARTRFHAAQVLLGLEHIHSKGIVYRDLKLENVLVDEKGHVQISDLGLAVLLGDSGKVRGYAGTPGYTAPEVVLGFQYNHIADFFSLGVMVYRCLCGRKPFLRRTRKRHDVKNTKQKQQHRKSSALDRNVIEMEPEFPPQYFSARARSLLKGLMTKNCRKRLGYENIRDIKDHPWFDVIDFGMLEAGYMQPPFDPPKLDQVHSPIGNNDGAPPQDKQYASIKITQEFDEAMKSFEYISSETIQDELVEVLKRADEEKRNHTDDESHPVVEPYAPVNYNQGNNRCLGCQIM